MRAAPSRRSRAPRSCSASTRQRSRSPLRGRSPPSLVGGTIYADFNTAAPALKRELAAVVPVPFVDVALIGVVPTTGLATRALASGAAADALRRAVRPARDAGRGRRAASPARRPAIKLLRSVFMKGIAAAAIETLAGAAAAGVEARLHADLAEVIGEPLLERLLTGSRAPRCPSSRRDARRRGVPRGAGRRAQGRARRGGVVRRASRLAGLR